MGKRTSRPCETMKYTVCAPSSTRELHLRATPQRAEMRDVLGDATKCMQQYKKHSTGPLGREYSFRAISATWRRKMNTWNPNTFPQTPPAQPPAPRKLPTYNPSPKITPRKSPRPCIFSYLAMSYATIFRLAGGEGMSNKN